MKTLFKIATLLLITFTCFAQQHADSLNTQVFSFSPVASKIKG